MHFIAVINSKKIHHFHFPAFTHWFMISQHKISWVLIKLLPQKWKFLISRFSLKKMQSEHFAVYEFHFINCARKKTARRASLIWIKLEADKCHAQQEDSWFDSSRKKTWNIIIAKAKCEIYGNFANCCTSFSAFPCYNS